MLKHISQHNTMCRLLYKNYLAGKTWKYTVAVDKAKIYLFAIVKDQFTTKKEKKKS